MVARLKVNAATPACAPLAYPAGDDQRFLPNVTGDSAGSALLSFFTLAGHDQSTCADCRDLGSIDRESASQVWRVDTMSCSVPLDFEALSEPPASSGRFEAVISIPSMTGAGREAPDVLLVTGRSGCSRRHFSRFGSRRRGPALIASEKCYSEG